MRIVADAGPLIHLHEAGGLHLLTRLDEVLIPPAVYAEVRSTVAALDMSPFTILQSLETRLKDRADEWVRGGLLHIGEAEAVALAESLGADWLVTDDAAARLFAEGRGIEVHGSLGVVLWAAAKRHLDKATAVDVLDNLAASSLWVSPTVLKEARFALDQLFRP